MYNSVVLANSSLYSSYKLHKREYSIRTNYISEAYVSITRIMSLGFPPIWLLAYLEADFWLTILFNILLLSISFKQCRCITLPPFSISGRYQLYQSLGIILCCGSGALHQSAVCTRQGTAINRPCFPS